MARVKIGQRWVGDGEAVFVIAEIGINHNGSVETARQLVDGARFAGCDAVKFQKRAQRLSVPYEQWYIMRDTPWGRMSYIDYRDKLEFGAEAFAEIGSFCRERELVWFASCWDEASVDFIEAFDPPVHKVASAALTDHDLLRRMKATGKPLTDHDLLRRMKATGKPLMLLAHATSSYPCRLEELNLRMIPALKAKFPEVPIGYSGHELGLTTTWAAVALGATFVERQITLDRKMWGRDQAASVEVMGMHRLVRDIRNIEKALGDGVKRVYVSEMAARRKLRRVATNAAAATGEPVFGSAERVNGTAGRAAGYEK
jgi:N-acetylneuraminate synthase